MSKIHPTALIAKGARLGPGVEVGAYSLVGDSVKIGKDTKVYSHVVLEGFTQIGERCAIRQSSWRGRGEFGKRLCGRHVQPYDSEDQSCWGGDDAGWTGGKRRQRGRNGERRAILLSSRRGRGQFGQRLCCGSE